MNPTSLTMLNSIIKGVNDKKALMNLLNIKVWQFNYLLNELYDQEYINKRDSKIYLKNNSKSILMRDVANNYDIKTLLRNSNEKTFVSLIKPRTVYDLQKETGMSRGTIYRTLSELESIGVLNIENSLISINSSANEPLYLLARILNTEKKRENIQHEDHVEIIYENRSTILKRVAKDKKAEGDLTAFSLFSEYGIEYHTTHDYFVEQDSDLTLEDVLIHAILAVTKTYDKNGMTMCIFFYIKNKNKMDLLAIKKIARKLDVIEVWSNIENYLRDNPITNQNLFPSKTEFEEKAKLYHIDADSYKLPNVYPSLFEEISTKIPKDVTIYLIGGENMRIKGLKNSTKDCDIVLDTKEAVDVMINVVENMGYHSRDASNLSKVDSRVQSFRKFSKADRSDIEIFYNNIIRKFYLSQRMKDRAKSDEKIFGSIHKLRLRLLANEDIFLLKAVTDREGDLYDMIRLVQHGNFDWDIVLRELEKQEQETGIHLSTLVLESIEDLMIQTKIKPPIHKKLIHNSIDTNILKLIVKKKGMYMDEVISILIGQDLPEKIIRNRIDSLNRKHLLRKYDSNKRVFLRPSKSQILRFHDIKDPLDKRYFVNPNMVSEYIKRILGNLHLYSILHNTNELSQSITSSPNFIASRPRNLAAAIVNVSAKLNGRGFVRRKDIANASGVSQASVTLLSKKIVRELNKSAARQQPNQIQNRN